MMDLPETNVTIVVSGPLGCGKTRIIHDAMEGLRDKGWEVVGQYPMQTELGGVETYTCKVRTR